MALKLVNKATGITVVEKTGTVLIPAPKEEIADVYNRGYSSGYGEGSAEGYKQGYNIGNEAGKEEGYTDGFSAGSKDGYDKGYGQGYNQGAVNGYNQGKTDGYTEGVAAAGEEIREEEYNSFWDDFQKGGKREDYRYAFACPGETSFPFWRNRFKPKYPLKVYYGDYMFYRFGYGGSGLDLVTMLEEAGVGFAYKSTVYNYIMSSPYMFQYSTFTRLPALAFGTLGSNCFTNNTNLVTIEGISVTGTTASLSAFGSNSALQNITFNGTVKCNIGNFTASTKLTVESMLSLFNALYDYKGSTAHQVKLGTTNLNKLTAEQKAIATAKNWTLS